MAAVAVGATALLAAACSAGQTAQTAMEQSTVDGATANAGSVALRNVRVAYPTGGKYDAGKSAVLQFDAVNTGSQPDQLVSIQTSAAASVALGPAGASSPSDGVSPSATPSASGSPSATSTGTPSGSSTPSPSSPSSSPSSSSSAAAGVTPVDLPQRTLVSFDVDAALAQLIDLTRPLISGQTLEITFTFAKGGTVTVAVPVATSLTEVEKAPPISTSPPEER
jgi:copper(I)-binding protein